MLRPKLFARADLIALTFFSLSAFVIGLWGIFNYGYIGQDYEPHHYGIVHFPDDYTFFLTDPPGFYWIGGCIYQHLSTTYYLELTALTFLILNTAALWVIYRLLWRCLEPRALRWAAAALVTFLPVRVIHSIVIAADALTVPIFALVVLFAFQLRENPRRMTAWFGLSVSLSLGMLSKYTFSGLLVPLILVLASTIVQSIPRGQRLRWSAIAFAALGLPASILIHEIGESYKGEGAITRNQWLPKGAPSVMRWSDMLSPQPSDTELFYAPAYFQDDLHVNRKYSYPGLVFISTVTDPLNLFQPAPATISTDWGKRTRDGFWKPRSDRDQWLQVQATRLGFPFFLLAIAGTLTCGVLGLQALLTKQSHLPNAAVVLAALAAGYYSPVFFGLHRIANPYGEGFWTARLILPALLSFFVLGFVLLDLVLRHQAWSDAFRRVARGCVAVLTAATCVVFASFLF